MGTRGGMNIGSAGRVGACVVMGTLVAAMLTPTAWGQPGKNDNLRERAREVLRPGGGDGGAGGDAGATGEAATSWSIVIVAYTGLDAEAAAQAALDRVRLETGLSGAYAERRGKSAVVAFGRYEGPGDEAARRDLERVRGIEWNGTRPFAGAVLAPPANLTRAGSLPQYDLREARRAGGRGGAGGEGRRGPAVYTLQVAVYQRPDNTPPTVKELEEFRVSAERAAVALRREGDEAYYCHLPTMSVVTIGLLTEEDYKAFRTTKDGSAFTSRPQESPRLRAMRQKYPHLLVNGQGVRIRRPGEAAPGRDGGGRDGGGRDGRGRDEGDDASLAPSVVVEIPRD